MTVIVSDPDHQSRRITVAALRYGGFVVKTATTPNHAMTVLRSRPVDAVVLDPVDPDPVEVVHELRLRTDLPIIVVSTMTDERVKVSLLDAGADDYLCKPFGVEEFLARVRVAVRRSIKGREEPAIITDDFRIELISHRTYRRSGEEVMLTPTEWRIVETLSRHQGHVVGHTKLLEETWGAKAVCKTNYLRVYIRHIRRKLEPNPAQPRYFITYPGLGHVFLPQGSPSYGVTGR
jgi:two-component system, OmpR family, KDP operon response regulator KdpE